MIKQIILSILAASVPAYAETVQQDSNDISQMVKQQEEQRQQQAVQERNMGGGSMPSMGGNSINPAAQMGQGSQNQGKDKNDSTGSALMAAGAALMASPYTMPAGIVLMAMGQLAKKQADHDGNAAGQSGATYAASGLGGGGSGTNPVKPNPSDPKGKSSYQDPKIADALKKFNDAGYKVTEDGLYHPDGKFTPASAFNTPASMAAAGLDPRGIKESQKILDVANRETIKGNKMPALSVVADGGGGGGNSSDDSNSSSASQKFDPFGLGAAQKKAMIAGKTVLFDGEPIGVAGNNIFEMVHTAYQKRRKGNQFIETEVASGTGPVKGMAPASVRGPANVPNR